MNDPSFQPRRWRESLDLAPLVEAESALSPPEGLQERIYHALALRFSPMAEAASDPELRSLLLRAALEPPAGLKERVLREVTEEALARLGLAEPARLAAASDPAALLLSRAATLDPPAGRRARGLLRLTPGPRRRRPAFVLAPLALAAALTGLVLFLWPRAHPPTGTSLAVGTFGPVAVLRAGALLAPHATLEVGDALTALSNDPQRLRLAGVGDFFFGGQGGRLALEKNDAGGVLLALSGGRIAVHAVHRPPTAPLVVEAGDTRVRIVGTIFSVDATGPNVRVAVREGLVRVTRGTQVTFVGSGQVWSASAGVSRSRPPSWANTLMQTLAGRAVPRPAPSAPGTARVAASVPPATSLAKAPPAPTSRPRPRSRPSPVTTAPLPPLASAAGRPAAAQPAVDLVALARGLMGKSKVELRRIGRDAARQGDLTTEAGALYALSFAADATGADRAATLAQLAHLLDEQLADPAEALRIWRYLADKSPADRPEAVASEFEVDVELGRQAELARAFAECVRACSPDDLAVARWTRALALADSPRYAALLKAAKRIAPTAQHAAVLTYEQRARLLAVTQPERARRLARFAAKLAPDDLDADVRALLNE